MIQYFFFNEQIAVIFFHFKSHFIFYFLLSINFFLVRLSKYNLDLNNNFLKNYKEIELTRTIVEPIKKATKLLKKRILLKKVSRYGSKKL